MRIAFAAWLYATDVPSGASRRAAGLLRALARRPDHRDREVVVLHGPAMDPARWVEDSETHARIRWQALEIPTGPTWRRALAERRHLPAVLARLGVDVVELGALPVPAGIPCPVSITIHDFRDLDGFRRRAWPKPWTRRIVRRSLARCAGVAVPSAFTAQRLADLVGSRTARPFVTVAAGGVERDCVRSRNDDRNPDPATILHVGHLEPRKDLATLVNATALLARRGHGAVRLRLVGADHGMRGSLENRARALGIADRVRFEGRITDEALTAAYDSATVVAIPSRYEGFGLPALEALARGCRVVARASGALPEVVTDGVGDLLGDESGDEAWADALARALADPTANAERAAKRAARLTWDHTADAMARHWTQVADDACIDAPSAV